VRDSSTPTTVNITWNEVNGAASYKVYLSNTGTGTGTEDGTSTTTSYDSINNSTTSTLYFSVSAVNGIGESSQSSWVSVGPASSGGTGGTTGTIIVKSYSSISNIAYVSVHRASDNIAIANSNTTNPSSPQLGPGDTQTFSNIPAGTYYVSCRINFTSGYDSSDFTLAAGETKNVELQGTNVVVK